MVVAPAGAHVTGKFAHLKKHMRQVATKVFNQKIGSASVANADTLDGLDSGSFALNDRAGRFAFARDDDNALVGPATNGVVLTTTITAPTNGHLAIDAGSDVFGGPDADTCVLQVDGTLLDSTRRTIQLSPADNNAEEDCSTEGAVAVAAGSHTVEFIATNPAAGVTYDEAVLAVTFVPYNATGALPAGPSLGRTGGSSGNN